MTALHTLVDAMVRRLELHGDPFERISAAPWIDAVEARYGTPLPDAYRHLLRNHRFPEFDLGGLSFYANLNSDSLEDVRVGPFVDPYMSPWLLARCFLPFARPDTGSYDPVCFDSSVRRHDPPIVRFDHEDILLERRKIKPVVLWPSFSELLAADP